MARSKGRTGRPWRTLHALIRSYQLPCWLCGQPINYTAPPRTRWSFTVDHAQPISKGGDPRTQDQPTTAATQREGTATPPH